MALKGNASRSCSLTESRKLHRGQHLRSLTTFGCGMFVKIKKQSSHLVTCHSKVLQATLTTHQPQKVSKSSGESSATWSTHATLPAVVTDRGMIFDQKLPTDRSDSRRTDWELACPMHVRGPAENGRKAPGCFTAPLMPLPNLQQNEMNHAVSKTQQIFRPSSCPTFGQIASESNVRIRFSQ